MSGRQSVLKPLQRLTQLLTGIALTVGFGAAIGYKDIPGEHDLLTR